METQRGKEYKELIEMKYPNQTWASECVLKYPQLDFFNQYLSLGKSVTFATAAGATTSYLSKGRKLWMLPFQIDFRVTNIPTTAGQQIILMTSNSDTNATFITMTMTAGLGTCDVFTGALTEGEEFTFFCGRTKYYKYRHKTNELVTSTHSSSMAGKTFEFGIYGINVAGAPTLGTTVELIGVSKIFPS